MTDKQDANLDDEIDKILLDMEWCHAVKTDSLRKATQAIKQLITKAETQARIDELEKLLLESEVVRTDGIVQSYGLFNATISDCIASLKATSNEDKA